MNTRCRGTRAVSKIGMGGSISNMNRGGKVVSSLACSSKMAVSTDSTISPPWPARAYSSRSSNVNE